MPGQDPADAIINEQRGSLGTQVWARNQYGPYAKARVSPLNAPSARRTANQDNLSAAHDAWENLLSQQQRLAWYSAYAYPLNGYYRFIRLNLNRGNLGLAILEDPPTPGPADPALTVSIDPTAAANGQLIISFTGGAGPNTWANVYTTPPLSTGRNKPSGFWRWLAALAPLTPQPIDLTTTYTSRFGDIASQSAVFVGIRTAIESNPELTPRVWTRGIIQPTVPTLTFYHSATPSNGAAGRAANLILLTPFELPGNMSISTVGINILAANAAVTGDFGIYDTAGNRITSIGGFSIASTGAQEHPLTGAPVALTAGSYYAAWTQTDTSGRIGLWNNPGLLAPIAADNSPTPAVAGVLPATIILPAPGITISVWTRIGFTLR